MVGSEKKKCWNFLFLRSFIQIKWQIYIYISDDDDDDDVIHVNIKWTNACALNKYMFLN